MTEAGKKLSLLLGRYVVTAEKTLEEQTRMKAELHKALEGRVKAAIAEMRKARASHVIGDYLHLRNTVGEGWGDLGRMIGKGALRVAGKVAADGLGINVKSDTVSRVMKALNKNEAKAGKVNKKSEIARNPGSLAEPIRMDRKAFAKRLKASGNQLHKTSLS